MRVFVPSRSRADATFNTVEFIPKRFEPTLVVPEAQVAQYQSAFPDYEVWGAPDGIGPTRQSILDRSPDRYVLMIDDDMKFHRRVSSWPNPKKYTRVDDWTMNDSEDMLETLRRWMEDDGIPAVGVSARQGNNVIENRWFREATRMNNFYGFDRDLLAAEGITFDGMKVMEDFHVTLLLFEKGYKNRVSVDYAWNQRGSNNRGGCSEYRTPEVQKESAHALYRQHRDYVTLVVKKTSPEYWFRGAERVDVRIAWRKAFKGQVDDSQ